MSECAHKLIKKQMVGEQVWYVCEVHGCGHKFRVEPWDGKVTVLDAEDSALLTALLKSRRLNYNERRVLMTALSTVVEPKP